MIGNGHPDGKKPNVTEGVTGLTHDVIELAELQVQLLQLDMRQSFDKARTCVILAVVGACLLLGTIPVALLTLAAVLYEQAGWSIAASAGVAALVGLLVTAAILGVAWSYMNKGMVTLERSRDELRRNVAWLKSTLRTRGKAQFTEQPINY